MTVIETGQRVPSPTTSALLTMRCVPSDFVLVSGGIDLVTDTATFDPVTELRGCPPATAPGNYQVQLLDNSGTVLSFVDFEANISELDIAFPGAEPPEPVGSFLVPVPKPTGTIASIKVLHNGSPIGTLGESSLLMPW